LNENNHKKINFFKKIRRKSKKSKRKKKRGKINY